MKQISTFGANAIVVIHRNGESCTVTQYSGLYEHEMDVLKKTPVPNLLITLENRRDEFMFNPSWTSELRTLTEEIVREHVAWAVSRNPK